ncbi:MAG: GDP-mannose 4,6-dehydratase [Eubacteriales bacterium]
MQGLDQNKTYFITGGAGFIGFFLSKKLLELGATVIGFDNMNDYYEVSLKEDRLKILEGFENYTFVKGDLSNKSDVDGVFETYRPEIVVNLGAQAGVRYSIDCPEAYMQSNMMGFFHILEGCRHYPVEHLVFASSSSVYGGNEKIPFSTTDQVDKPVSLYAATKKSNELMAYSYSKLYQIPVTGLRFFTVYGPMGRPDMAYFKFAKKIMAGEKIQIYNNGDMYRDFTYIDDIVIGIENMLCNSPAEDDKGVLYKIYNIGNNKPEKLMDYINTLEKCLGKEAVKEFLPMQPGDVYQTYADVSDLMEDFDFKPSTTIEEGLSKFVEWFKEYYQ